MNEKLPKDYTFCVKTKKKKMETKAMRTFE